MTLRTGKLWRIHQVLILMVDCLKGKKDELMKGISRAALGASEQRDGLQTDKRRQAAEFEPCPSMT
jgi:hypothetical protein